MKEKSFKETLEQAKQAIKRPQRGKLKSGKMVRQGPRVFWEKEETNKKETK